MRFFTLLSFVTLFFVPSAYAEKIIVLKLPPEWQTMNEEHTQAKRKVDFVRQSESMQNYSEIITQTLWRASLPMQDRVMKDEDSQLRSKCKVEKDSEFVLFECAGTGWSGVKRYYPVGDGNLQSISYQVKELPLSAKRRKEIEDFFKKRTLLCDSSKPEECMKKVNSNAKKQ